MNVKNAVSAISNYIREGEQPGCPYFVLRDGLPRLAVFTYYAENDPGITVYGYGQELIVSDDNYQVEALEKDYFQSESELIKINDMPPVTARERDSFYESYYTALQRFFDCYPNVDDALKDELAGTFRKIISNDALELFRRMCPEFLQYLSL